DALASEMERVGVSVRGFAGLPTLHRPDPAQQHLFVNGRPVKDKLLIGAVRAAYGDLLPRGRYPLLALFVKLAPQEVDVNVHPCKAEVRFRYSGRLDSLIGRALRQALQAAGHRAAPPGGTHTIEALARASWDGSRSQPRAVLHGHAEIMQAPLAGLDAPSADARAAEKPA